MTKAEKETCQLMVKYTIQKPKAMFLRTVLAEGTDSKLGDFEISLNASGATIHIQKFGEFSYSVSLEAIAEAVLAHRAANA